MSGLTETLGRLRVLTSEFRDGWSCSTYVVGDALMRALSGASADGYELLLIGRHPDAAILQAVPPNIVVARSCVPLLTSLNGRSALSIDAVAYDPREGRLLGAELALRDFSTRTIRISSPWRWLDGPLHGVIALHAIRRSVELPGAVLEPGTRRFCSVARFTGAVRHAIGTELHHILRAPHAHRTFEALGDLGLLTRLTRWCFRMQDRIEPMPDRKLGADITRMLHVLDALFVRPSNLPEDVTEVLRYAAWMTAIDRAAGELHHPSNTRHYARAMERAVVGLTAQPVQAFRATVIAVAYRRAAAAVFGAGRPLDETVNEIRHELGDLKGGCAAALLIAHSIMQEGPQCCAGSTIRSVVESLSANRRVRSATPFLNHARTMSWSLT